MVCFVWLRFGQVHLVLSLFLCLLSSWSCEDESGNTLEPEAGSSLAGEGRVINPEEGGDVAGESAGDSAGADVAGESAGDSAGGDVAGESAGEPIDLSQIKLNELVSKGEPYDWVEIHNMGMTDLDLSGYWLSDKLDELNRFVLPNGLESLIPAQGFTLFILEADSTGFSLSGNEGVYLSTPNGEIIDQIEYTNEVSIVGTSYGRLPDGLGEWQLLYEQTPGGPNRSGTAPQCGDGICEPSENCEADCIVCGDGLCDIGERCELDCQIGINLVINEVLASGTPDGVELVNTGDEEINLSTIYITDDRQVPNKARLEGFLPAQTYLWVELSDETVGFKLKGDEELYLFDEELLMIDGVDWEEGDSPEGLSFARSPDLSGEFMTNEPSPGEPND